jgi:ABC-type glycerol-3-phosphate transport system substrate-binding protein
MKKLAVFVLTGAMLLSLAACGAKAENETDSPADTAVQSTSETVSTDNNDEAGSAAADSEAAEPAPDWWPDNDLAAAIPIFSKGSLMNVMDTDSGFIIALEAVESADYDAYLPKAKDAFAKDGTEANDSDMKTYVGSNKAGQKISLIYDMNAKTLHISADQE